MASRQLLLKAAWLLEQQALELRENCEGLHDRLWDCSSCRKRDGKCQVQVDHDAMVDTAKKLREAA